MSDLIIQKKNEVYVKIDCDPSIGRELADFFTFFVPGYKFMPAYRNKLWDGRIRLFDQRTGLIYAGLLAFMDEFCNHRQYTVEFIDNEYYGRADAKSLIEPEEIYNFSKELNLQSGGNKISAKDYQLEAVYHALTHHKALLISPTASGKSLIIYMMLRWFLEKVSSGEKEKVLIVVPTTSLVEQMVGDFADYSARDESFDAEKECHKIYSGKEKLSIKSSVVVTTWQSIFKLPKAWFEQFGMIIGDEAHTFKAKSLTKIMESLTNAKYRIGTTGTLDGTQTHELVLQGVFGPKKQVTTTRELIDSDTLSKVSISMLVLKYSQETCREVTKKKYQDEINFIVSHEARNNFIANLAIKQEGNTLVLFNLVAAHGKPLYEKIKKKIEDKYKRSGRKVFFVAGETDVIERENIRAITEKEEDAIIVASLGTFSTGINIRNLHNIIFASPSKSQVKVLQSIGRILRKATDGRNDTKVYDLVDDLHYKSKKNYTLLHGGERMKIYTKEKLDYKLYEVPLEND